MNTGDPNLYANPYSYLLYIENPVGVGYSTCEGKKCLFDEN
jgi:carboxypeptidase C (cathepsin A)